jgi:hypothetical protein
MVDILVLARQEEAARAVLTEMRTGRLAEDAAPASETE